MPESGRPLPPFQRLQYRFAAHLRDPQRHPAPAGIEPRRMKIYADLFYNNVQSFLATAFPVLRRLTPDRRWHALVRDFYARHESHDPLFRGIAAEFVRYLQDERAPVRGDPPWLQELAHYEWVELALSLDPQRLTPALADPNGDLLAGVPVLSPLAWPLSYRFPVHRIGPECRPRQPSAVPTHLVVYRDRQDEVRFMEVNPVTARLLELLRERPVTGRRLLLRIARELRHPEPERIVDEGAGILRELRARDIVLGIRRPKGA